MRNLSSKLVATAALGLFLAVTGFTVTGCGLSSGVSGAYNSITPASATEEVECTDLGVRAGDNYWRCIWDTGKALCSDLGVDADGNPCDPQAPSTGLGLHADTKVEFTWVPTVGGTTGVCKVSYSDTKYETPEAQTNTRLGSNVAAYGIVNMDARLEFFLQSPGVICTAPPLKK